MNFAQQLDVNLETDHPGKNLLKELEGMAWLNILYLKLINSYLR